MKYVRLTRDQLTKIIEMYNDEKIGLNERVEIYSNRMPNGDNISFIAEKERIGNYINVRLYWANLDQLES